MNGANSIVYFAHNKNKQIEKMNNNNIITQMVRKSQWMQEKQCMQYVYHTIQTDSWQKI